MNEDQALKHCRGILKKNNLHPLKKLGRGAFSFVFSVEKIELKSANNEVYSVKCISKKQFSQKPYLIKYIQQQIQSMRDLDHRNIVKLTRTFEDQGWIFIVMEYCDKGNIYSFQASKENNIFQFKQCVYIIRSVLEGLSHIHSKNLIHRDIKAENILLISTSNQEPYGYVTKICDLGFCRQDDDNVNTFCGTTSYMAPQIFKKIVYDSKVDIWAVGVLMHKMLFGDFPFKSINMEYQINSKCNKGYNLRKMKLKHNTSISEETFGVLVQIFSGIFTINPAERMGVDQLQKYSFFQTSQKHIPTMSTDSGDEQQQFENEKLVFIEQILKEMKSISILGQWEQICFEYYIKKVQFIIIQPFANECEVSRKQVKDIEKSIGQLENYINCNLKKNTIPKFPDFYSPKAVKFTNFKQPYRLVIGFAFSKAHKHITSNVTLRSQIKLQLFCLHLINRIFQKEYRNVVFSHFYDWLASIQEERKFTFKLFKSWIKSESSEKLVQTIQMMNDKFYKKK